MGAELYDEIFSGWKIEGAPLGAGAYGIVYKAVRREQEFETISASAIKIITVPSNSSETDILLSEGMKMEDISDYYKSIVNGFLNEIKLMESVKGSGNIVNIEDFHVVSNADSLEWKIYIRMELLTPLDKYLVSEKMKEQDVVKLGIDICTALETCSKKEIIHRDIKPANIFRTNAGDFKLGDFGVAKKLENKTGEMSKKGSYFYMAPEVYMGEAYDARADIYSLGIVLYRLLNQNRIPFIDSESQLKSPEERSTALSRRMRGERLYMPCEATENVAAVVLRACEYDMEKRYANASDFKSALLCLQDNTFINFNSDKFDDADNMDKTVAVRKPPSNEAHVNSQDENIQRQVHEFSTNKNKNKHSRLSAIVLSGLGIAFIFFICSLIYNIFRMQGSQRSNDDIVINSEQIKGDINNDGVINTLDYTEMSQNLKNRLSLLTSDMNCDNKINKKDLEELKKVLLD